MLWPERVRARFDYTFLISSLQVDRVRGLRSSVTLGPRVRHNTEEYMWFARVLVLLFFIFRSHQVTTKILIVKIQGGRAPFSSEWLVLAQQWYVVSTTSLSDNCRHQAPDDPCAGFKDQFWALGFRVRS